MNPISFLITNQRRSQNTLLAVGRQSLTNYLLTVKHSWPCGLSQCDTLHSDTNVAVKHAASVFNVKVSLPNMRAAKRFTAKGTGMTSSCRTQTQSFMITKTSYIIWMVKVKCTLVQALRLCTGRTARKGSIALLFLDHVTGRGEGSASRPGRSLPRERPGWLVISLLVTFMYPPMPSGCFTHLELLDVADSTVWWRAQILTSCLVQSFFRPRSLRLKPRRVFC